MSNGSSCGSQRFSSASGNAASSRFSLISSAVSSVRFEREAEKSVAEKAAATASVERATALAWLERYYAEALLKVVAEQIEQVKGEIGAAEAVYRGGRGSQADVIGAHSTLAALEDKASELRRRVLFWFNPALRGDLQRSS